MELCLKHLNSGDDDDDDDVGGGDDDDDLFRFQINNVINKFDKCAKI